MAGFGKFGAFVSEAGKNAKGMLDKSVEKVVQAVDQNDDGKFDLSDVSAIADSMGKAVKKGTQVVLENAEEKARLLEFKALNPIFPEQTEDVNFSLPKFIRVADRDKRHAESDMCQGSIGYLSDQKEMELVTVFRDSISSFNLDFYPDSNSEFYYIDPTDRDCYIALDEYFSHLKIVRINELQKLAQDLGAKHFKVTYKEEQTAFSEKKLKGSMKSPIIVTNGEQESAEKKYSTVEIAAEMTFSGHAPIEPQLRYLQKDPSVQTLVAMRLDSNAPLLNQKFMIKLSNSSGLKESEAVKIDAVLKGMKYSGNCTVASEAKNESRRYLEYEIDF